MNSTLESTLPKYFEILKERKITVKQVSDATGIPQTTMSSWRSGVRKPKLDAIETIANYLDVPVDYLLGKESENAVDEKLLIEFKRLSDSQKEHLKEYIKFLLSQNQDQTYSCDDKYIHTVLKFEPPKKADIIEECVNLNDIRDLEDEKLKLEAALRIVENKIESIRYTEEILSAAISGLK